MLLNRCQFLARNYMSSISLAWQKKAPSPPPMHETPRKLLYMPAKKTFDIQETQVTEFLLKPEFIPKPQQPDFVITDHRQKFESREINPVTSATLKAQKTSVKKTVPYAKRIIGKSYYDAYSFLDAQDTKASKLILRALESAKSNAINNNLMDQQRLFVKTVITGRNTPIRRIKIHAKGKMGHMTRPRTQIQVILEQKSVQQIYEITKSGEYPRGLARLVREMFFKEDGSFDMLKKNALLLTSKGRRLGKLQFKRQIDQKVKSAKDQGYFLSEQTAKAQILEKEGTEFAQSYESKFEQFNQQHLTERQKIFQANEKKYS